jgi:uncharacterized protein YjbI with pentapeptide repeats
LDEVYSWNEEHLAKLREGVTAWNKWRQANRFVQPDLEDANLRGFSLVDADLSHTSLLNTIMMAVDARGARLYYCNLEAARLDGANLEGAKLTGARLDYAHMRGVNLRGTDLFAAVFDHTELADADLTGSRVGRTIFGGIDFRQVRGLEDVEHQGQSTIGIESLIMSEGQIPEVFLRGAGVSDVVIQYAASLAKQPIQFYSCFISHSSQDQGIASRLYAELQAQGVRCWYAPVDLAIGDKFRERIDQSIRMHEKLLLILSNASIGSPWVETEVEAAFERETRTGRLVVFPIRVDDAIMGADAAWAANIRRTRHIGDFIRWKDQDAFIQSFQRLMRDLRSTEDTGRH